MVQRHRPPYIERGGTQDLPNPFALLGVKLSCFTFAASRAALDALLDAQLNRVVRHAQERRRHGLLAYRFRCLVPYVALVVTRVERIQLLQGGFMPEIDVAFWVPVLVERKVGPLYVPTFMAFYQPYLFVDSGEAMATGRETYGYHKMLGRFVLPEDPADVARVECQTVCFEDSGRDTQGHEQLLFALERTSTESRTDSATSLFDRLTDGLLEMPEATRRSVLALAKKTGLNGVSQLFLKQFRSIEDPKVAAYQAITMVKCPLTGVRRSGRIPGQFALRIVDKVSHPLRADLGLPAGPLVPVDQRFSEFDFNLAAGKTLVEV